MKNTKWYRINGIVFLVLVIQTTILSQFEIVELQHIHEQSIIKANDVKAKIKLQKFGDEFVEVAYIYYSKLGNIDSSKFIHPAWMMSCPPPNSHSYKRWITNKFNNQEILEDKETSLKLILNGPDLRIDSMVNERSIVTTNYVNSQNLFEHYYMDTSKQITLRSIFKYDDNYKLQSKIVYTNYIKSKAYVANGIICTYYIYDEHGLLIKEIEKEIDSDKGRVKKYSYHNSKLVKSLSTNSSEFKFEYLFYE